MSELIYQSIHTGSKIDEAVSKVPTLEAQINTLVAKAKTVLISEPYNQTIKTTVNLGFRPRVVTIFANILGTNFESDGVANATIQNVKYRAVSASNTSITPDATVFFMYNSSNTLSGVVTITDTGIEILWTLTGTLTGASGNRRLIISAY